MTAGRLAAACARDAVAVELLLTCSMRVGNLVDLRLGETIRRFGEGATTPAGRSRSRRRRSRTASRCASSCRRVRAAARALPGPLARPLVRARRHPGCFPTTGAGTWIGVPSESIARRAQHHVGAAITCHQFRHLAAELYLREDPNGLGLVSQHLGHRDLNTTRRYYAREQTRIATQRYHDVLTGSGQAASPSRRAARQREIRMTSPRLSLAVDRWPELDRERWRWPPRPAASSRPTSPPATGARPPAHRRAGLRPMARLPGPRRDARPFLRPRRAATERV